MNKQGRNYGLDLYRILAMLMITILHVNSHHFDLLYGQNSYGTAFTGWFIEYICLCGVNCFAILTGYLSNRKPIEYDKKWFGKLFDIWTKSAIFGIFVYCAWISIMKSEVFSWKELLKLLFFTKGALWYIKAYICMLVFLPFLSGMTARISAKSLAIYTFFSVALFCVITIPQPHIFFLESGYSSIWLIICFIWGESLHRFAPAVFRWKYHTLLLSIGAVSGAVIPFIIHFYLHNRLLFSYLSPFCVLEAVCLLLLCSKIKITSPAIRKILVFLSTYSLGIYLFQAQPVIWKYLFQRHPTGPRDLSQIFWQYPALVSGIAIIGTILFYLVSKICSLRFFGWVKDSVFSIIEKMLFPYNREN